MAENSKIAWCDDTFNPWIGCQKVSAGCLNCYAERQNNFYKWVPEWGKDYRLTGSVNWQKPIQWAKHAVKDGVIRRVFCASLADVFDKNVINEWRHNLFDLIDKTGQIGGLEWLLLTKRPENIEMLLPVTWLHEPPDYVRIGVTCENQEMADVRIPKFLSAWKGKSFVSVEPMLSKVNLQQCRYDGVIDIDCLNGIAHGVFNDYPFPSKDNKCKPIDWVIAGCESDDNKKPGRPMNIEWVRDLRDQCQNSNTPFFLKQMAIDGKLVAEPELDGRQWLEFPGEK